MDNFTSKDYWRLIILYGLNVATYKIAFAKCLKTFVDEGLYHVSMERLADAFLDEYIERSKKNMPQLVTPGRITVMERVVSQLKIDNITKDYAIEYVKKNAFNDVIFAFQQFNSTKVPFDFYTYDKSGLFLSEGTHLLLSNSDNNDLMTEVDSRWDLLEASFLLRKNNSVIENDIREFYLSNGYERKNITQNIPVLYGYQKGRCFYCGESLEGHNIHVDHVIPRQLIYHDEIWNLVLSHDYCNLLKSDSVPGREYIEKLLVRNEHFIASNHPIKDKLLSTIGKTQKQRRYFIEKVYSDAKLTIPYVWEGIKNYNSETDELYKSLLDILKK